ncbi:MAG: CTP-dependent riboflavin kinase [Candidatus Bathyarchaeota archaeon]|jgi:riboflavin kinase|nr:CTP-dependent riboflavin kinase [Candidatus Bathyarchaeota archaeon A05DMB-5]MDH7557101.1 CTP-dependent riboflavin kinase [Candidatus Bathyarchaeota archaeon]
MNHAIKKLKTLNVKGKVFSGSGEGSRFTSLPWVKEQIEEKLGFSPSVGTLNIKLLDDYVGFKKQLKKASIEILPEKGFCRGRCLPALFMGETKCVIVIPEIAHYPEDVIEVIAPINLREKFRLKDSDLVEVNLIL